jgi:hypothetical protein
VQASKACTLFFSQRIHPLKDKDFSVKFHFNLLYFLERWYGGINVKKQTRIKWYSGVATAITAASFIGIVQTHGVEVNTNPSDTEVSYTETNDAYDWTNEENREEFDDGFDDDEGFEKNNGQSDQGLQPSERRTRHS